MATDSSGRTDDAITLVPPSGHAEQRAIGYLLTTWNPAKWSDDVWNIEDWDASVEGLPDSGEWWWSVGQRRHGIDVGDRVYMLMQGYAERGIVARGVVVSEGSAPDDSVVGDDGERMYANIVWEAGLPIGRRITIETLEREIPQYNWRTVLSSGRNVVEIGAELDRLWSDAEGGGSVDRRVAELSTGAGFGTPEQNRRIERAAVDHVRDVYQSRGYVVESVESEKCGWDLKATKDGIEARLEVKGVGGSRPRILLTANEFDKSTVEGWRLCVVLQAMACPRLLEFDGATVRSWASSMLYRVALEEAQEVSP